MPVINFSYTDNLDIDSILKDFLPGLHQTLVEVIGTNIYSCRTTINKCENYYIGDGAKSNAFIQLNIAMLPGRTKEVKDTLGNVLYKKINDFFVIAIEACDAQIRVCLTETDTNFYFGLGDS